MKNKMEVILTLNGRQYSIRAPPGWVLEPDDIERAKQDILSGKISVLNPATCHDVVQGTPQTITLTANGGQADYTYKLLLDGSQIATFGPTASTSHTFSVAFNQTTGSHTLKGEITDSCSTPQTSSDQCTFNITTATGSISCTTIPSGASVFLDPISQGVVTPVTLTNISAGIHIVTFMLSGYNACPVSVTVTAGSTATASCTLTPLVTTGSISCTTIPAGASIALDGVSQGVVTPVTLTNISAGIHIVTFTLSGYNARSESVNVTAGSTAVASCTLTVTTGSISCTTIPAGASIALDGVSQGVVTPVTLTNISVGIHTVTFTLSGYNACSESVNVTAGSTAVASCTLTVTTGRISCTTTPAGAAVALDGVSQGVVTPVTLTNISAGIHTVTFTLSGYNACSESVYVTAGSTATASCTLTSITNICTWITNNGGVSSITIPKILNLVDAYLGTSNIGFIPTSQQIFGCVDYYLGFNISGNNKTGCCF